MISTPAQTERLTVIALSALGVVMFVLFAGLGGWSLWSKMHLVDTHQPVTVKVEAVDTLCEVQRRSGKSWLLESVHACDEAARVVAEHTGMTRWRSVEVPYAAVAYTAGGAAQQKLMRASEVSVHSVKAGDEVAMYANPDDPKDIQRPIHDSDYSTFWTLFAVGAGVGVLVAVLGKWLGRLNRNRQEAALAAGGTVNPNGTVNIPQATPDGRTIELEVPLWAKIVGIVGTIVLFAGLAIAAIGLIANTSSGEGGGDATFGSLIIAAIALVIWRASRMIAALGTKARAR